MSFQNPDRIIVEEYDEIEVIPNHAVLTVLIQGESYVFGDEAFKKSKELASFISELETIDYSSDNISLDNISIQTASGKIMKSSSVKFILTLDRIDLEKLPSLFGIIAEQKNIEILRMAHQYKLAEQKTELYKKLCLAAKIQGQAIAESFAVPLLSVYSMTPNWILPETDAANNYLGATMSRSRGIAEKRLDGLNFVANYKGNLALSLKVEFRVGEFVESKRL